METVAVVGDDETPASGRALDLLDKTDHPVLMLSPQSHAERNRITVAVDLDEPTEELLAFAFSEASRSGRTLHVLNVWAHHTVLFYDAMYESEFAADAGIVAHREAELLDVLQPWKARYPDVECSYEVRTGSIGESLTDASKDADVLVLGGRRHGAAPGIKTGPALYTLLCHSECLLAVVPIDGSPCHI